MQSKIEEVVSTEVERAQGITFNLCSSFAASAQQHAPYNARLQGEGRLMAARLKQRLRLSILQSRHLREIEAPTIAEQDDLLPLLRRKSFDSDLVAVANSATNTNPVSLLMIDIDHFKNVNDTHGHPAGDEVLKGCAAVIKERSRYKGKAYRYGGEEMAVVLLNFTTAEAVTLAETIRSGVESKTITDKGLSVTVSIGVATIPNHAVNAEALLAGADQALYSAKKSGRNRVHCAGDVNTVVTPRKSDVDETRTAEQKQRLLDSIDLAARLEQANGQHIELKIENRSDLIVQLTKILLLCNGVKAAEYNIETNVPGRLVRRSQNLISWVDTPGLAQAIQDIRGEFDREFDDFVEIQLQVEALDQLKMLPSQKIKVKVEPGGRRVWQIR